MFSKVNDDSVLVDNNIERNASAGMEDWVEAQSLFVSEVVCFNVGGERIDTVRTIVKIEIDDTKWLALMYFCHFGLERCLIPHCRAPEMAMASQFLKASCANYAKGLPLAAKVHRTICLSLAMHDAENEKQPEFFVEPELLH